MVQLKEVNYLGNSFKDKHKFKIIYVKSIWLFRNKLF